MSESFLFKVRLMIEILYSREKDKIKAMTQEIQETIQGILQILDTEYGADRNKNEDNGGHQEK